jgi:hypothetical protein
MDVRHCGMVFNIMAAHNMMGTWIVILGRALFVRLLPMCHLFRWKPNKSGSYLEQHLKMAAINNGMHTSVATTVLTTGGKVYLCIT